MVVLAAATAFGRNMITPTIPVRLMIKPITPAIITKMPRSRRIPFIAPPQNLENPIVNLIIRINTG
jgi:hypothetical protein